MDQGQIDTEVVIVGAGPCGLAMANLLGLMGVTVVVLEKNESTVREPRAVSIDDESLRTMQAIGIVDAVISRLMLDYGSRYVGAAGKTFAFIHPTTREFGYPRRSAFHQMVLEDQLRQGLVRFANVSLLFNHELLDFSQTQAHVDVRVRAPEGEVRVARCTYLIACDGARSTVRTQLDIPMVGSSYRERWLIIDIEETKDTYRHTRVMCDPKRPGITLPGRGRTRRFEFRLNAGEEEEEVLTDDFVRGLLRRSGPDGEAKIRRKTVYAFHARMAKNWREGRVFLAGDAAHLSPPFAGQGMNSGIRDAHNLSWKIAAVLKGVLGPGLLESYQRERRSHAWALIMMAVRMGHVFMPSSKIVSWLTRTGFRIAGLFPPVRDYFSQMKYKPKPRFASGFFVPDGRSARATKTGRLFPQPRLETLEGKEILLDDVLENRFALIAYGANPHGLDAADDPLFARLDAVRIRILPQAAPWPDASSGAAVFRDKSDALAPYFSSHSENIILLRPDRYVMAAMSAATARETLLRLNLLCGSPHPVRVGG